MVAPLTRQEFVTKLFSENLWYLALAEWFTRTQHPAAWSIGVAMVVCVLADQVLGRWFLRTTGKPLDEMSAFNQRLRFFSGRRSMYLVVLLAGFLAGSSLLAFQLVLVWAVLTLALHAGCAALHLRRKAT